MRRATYAAVGIAALLVVVKAAAWLSTGSIAILSSLIDSCIDVAASLLNLLAVRQALVPADREHRFGHGKAEAVAGLGQAAFILGSALFLVFEAIRRLLAPEPVVYGVYGMAVMVFAMAATIALVQYQRHVIRRTRSVAVSADSLHYRSDILLNGAVLAALALTTWLDWPWADPVFALAVAGYILHSAWAIARSSLDLLMDRELPRALRERIIAIVQSHPEVRAVHDLRTRSSGTQVFIQLHVELDGNMTLDHAHAIGDDVERQVLAAFPGAEVIIHHDPAGLHEAHPTFG
ncbi:MAG: cation diffusion facilitator family transporter [Alphaproteobacteria bacterium]|nr:cation diffusion facilitator family transporter [Alphaproteobacteria bacterium]